MDKRVRTLLLLTAAGWIAAGLMSRPASAGGTTYDDPFDYCAAVGTVDRPGSPYSGPAMPDMLARKLKAATGASVDAPLALFREGAFWRCMGGEVFACTVGANLPCMTKADSSREPSPAVRDFCREQPDAEVVPAVVTGRATIYAWRCAAGQPVIEGAPRAVDAAGFLADIWYRLQPD